jgi:hypothetical protein
MRDRCAGPSARMRLQIGGTERAARGTAHSTVAALRGTSWRILFAPPSRVSPVRRGVRRAPRPRGPAVQLEPCSSTASPTDPSHRGRPAHRAADGRAGRHRRPRTGGRSCVGLWGDGYVTAPTPDGRARARRSCAGRQPGGSRGLRRVPRASARERGRHAAGARAPRSPRNVRNRTGRCQTPRTIGVGHGRCGTAPLRPSAPRRRAAPRRTTVRAGSGMTSGSCAVTSAAMPALAKS